MYTRVPSGRMPRGMRVPENYAGNAFRPLPYEPPHEKRMPIEPRAPHFDAPPPPDPIDTVDELAREEEPPQKEHTDLPPEPQADTVAVGAKPSSLGWRLPFRLPSFGTGLSIGFEELLLLGLILLISQEGKNDDLILLLILLLFIQ